MNEINVKWHPYPKEKPPKEGFYLITFGILGNYVRMRKYSIKNMWGINSKLITDNDVIAWAELPKPFDIRRKRNFEVDWQPYPGKIPYMYGKYLVTVIIDNKRFVEITTWYPTIDKFDAENIKKLPVIAWAELPEPYCEKEY